MRVGVMGGGQLGRMLALAGAPLGISTVHLDPAGDACAGQVAPVLVGRFDDPALVAELARGADVLTVELEQVPLAAFEHVPREVPILPPVAAIAVAQDRLLEKRLFQELDVPAPRFLAVDGPEDADAAIDAVGLPLLLKTRYGGYDGRGQALVESAADLVDAIGSLGGGGLIAEQLVAFDREVSVVAVRGLDGEIRAYPLVENLHREGILRVSLAPAHSSGATANEAVSIAGRIMERLGHVGALTVELFDAGGGLLANEIAPRVHNSGHWTIEGAETSQFENHLRAVCGLPLGSTDAVRPSGMVNLIGSAPDPPGVLAIPGARLHLYGKQPRPGRKVGHVTVTAPDDDTLAERLGGVRALVGE